jgi:hypothetical protein
MSLPTSRHGHWLSLLRNLSFRGNWVLCAHYDWYTHIDGVGLQPLACWDCGFKSRRGHVCLSLLSIVSCQVEVPPSGRWLVQRSLTECGVPECDCEASKMRTPWPARGCRATKKKSYCDMLRPRCWARPLGPGLRNYGFPLQLFTLSYLLP